MIDLTDGKDDTTAAALDSFGSGGGGGGLNQYFREEDTHAQIQDMIEKCLLCGEIISPEEALVRLMKEKKVSGLPPPSNILTHAHYDFFVGACALHWRWLLDPRDRGGGPGRVELSSVLLSIGWVMYLFAA
jgi:hypothetical protein